MKIKEIKITPDLLKKYKAQSNVFRSRESRGGYEAILSATDADLDRRKPRG